MNAAKREAELAHLRARRQELQRELARVQRQIVQADRRLQAAEKQIAGLIGEPRRAA